MMTRRNVLKLAAIVSASGTLNGCAALNGGSGGARRDYLLVHGAWHGGWCWRRVSDRLMSAGHRVFAPSLTGLGDRRHLLNREVNLETHIQDIIELIGTEELRDVILVGHSYGGIVITGFHRNEDWPRRDGHSAARGRRLPVALRVRRP